MRHSWPDSVEKTWSRGSCVVQWDLSPVPFRTSVFPPDWTRQEDTHLPVLGCFVTLVPCVAGYESRACSDSEESSEVDCVLEPLSDRCLVKLGPCRMLVKEDQPSGNSPTPELARRGASPCGAGSATDSAESEASDSAHTESRGCRTSGSSESMDALEEDDLDACSSSRSDFFRLGSSGFSEGLDSDSLEDRNRIETSGFLCLLDLAQSASAHCQKTACSQQPASETCSWGPELSVGRLDPRLYEGSRDKYYSLCSSISPASHLSDSSESTASRQGVILPAWSQQGWTEPQPSSTLEALPLHPPLAFEEGSSDEEYYDAADKLTPPDVLSGEPPQEVCRLSRQLLGLGPSLRGQHMSNTGSLSTFKKVDLDSLHQITSIMASSQGCERGSVNCGQVEMGKDFQEEVPDVLGPVDG